MKNNKQYIPKTGERCLISSPNCDDINGYVYCKFKVLWINKDFILYGNEGFYPNLNKLDHVAIKEIK